ncbi:MAG TPA: dihydrofolate reductase family protein [Chloroflexota bacterium]|nr:dihydrofolate reductase family protein [Chloroflexota bacterium]
MRKIIVTMWITLDGFIAGPNNDMSWIRVDDAMGRYEGDLVGAADTLMLGRVTYQSFAGAWPYVPDNPAASEGEKEYARQLNSMRKIVFSRTLEAAEWNNSTLYHEINPDDIAALKQESGKNIVIYGSASIVQALTARSLIDEYQLLVHPVILGGGKRLFGDGGDRADLRLVEAKTFDSGVVLLTYQPAGRE